MAKSGKIVQLFQKPENFIKSRARELMLGKCYITDEWEETGIANILVSRKHTNGNFTLGIYLIDLKCLGIKDTMFKFNVTEEELNYFAGYVGGNEIEYNEVHNIIYGAVDFANDCGFKAHKDWAITQFILEEDNDAIPLIDIEFGEDSVPAYYVGPNDSPAKIKQVLAILDKNIGTGNYLFYNEEDQFDDDLFPDEDSEETLTGMNGFKQIYVDLTDAYRKEVRDKKVTNLDEDLILGILYQMTIGRSYSVDYDLEEEITACVDSYESVFEEKSPDSIVEINKILLENPKNPYLYVELFLQYKSARLDKEANMLANEGMELFPDFLYFRFFVAHAAMVDNELEKGFNLLNGNYYLNQGFSQRKSFAEGEFMFFYSALCEYFLAKDDINSAIVCSYALIDGIYDYECNENAILHLCTAIKNKIR